MAQEFSSEKKLNIPVQKDSVDHKKDTLSVPMPKPEMVQDSTETDSTKTKVSGALEHNVQLSAKDKIKTDRKTGRTILRNHAKIVYGDMTLEAGVIIFDRRKNELYARGITDSTGYTQAPVFKQGNQVVKPDSIRFNFKTKKALVYNSRTQQGQINVKAEVTKRVNDSVYFMRHVKFTTSEDIDDPEYYFYAQKVKFVPNKKVVSGLIDLYIADVPTPLILPFGYFPLTSDRSSGFIIPSFGNSGGRGFSFQNGGYYFAISDYLDLTALGDYYTNGSYGIRLESSYAYRYHYRGNFSFRYENILHSERGFPDFSKSSNYNIRWSHQQDPKANPNSRFSARVNMGSSKYYRQSFNENNSGNFLNNNLSSSVSYSKTFPGEPQFRFSVTATQNQNTNTQEINMTLPTLQASISRIYPFAPKSGVKKGVIQNINFQYDFRGENRYKTTDSLFFKPQMFNSAKTGIEQTIPISTNFKLFKYFSVSLGANYKEDWVFNTYKKSYDTEREKVDIDTIRGFDSFRTYGFNASIGTTVYGMFKFGKDSKIQAIRHVMKPFISYSMTPSFSKFYDTYLVPSTSGLDPEVVDYSRFEGTLFGAPNKDYASTIGFSLTNDFEAKIKSDSIGGKPEKRELLSNLRFSTAYNLAADSLRLRPITFSGTLPIIKDKLSINFNGALDPYALNNNNQRIDRLNIENGGSLFRLTRGNISFSYSLSSKEGKGEQKNMNKATNETFRNGGRPDDLFGKPMNEHGSMDDDKSKPKTNETERYHYTIPWDLQLAYTMTYNNLRRQNEISSHSVMISGNAQISPRWKVGISTGYDLKNRGFTYTQLRFERDLKSWRMSFSWTPFGIRESWYFFIGIKANVFSDIKYDKRREPDRRL